MPATAQLSDISRIKPIRMKLTENLSSMCVKINRDKIAKLMEKNMIKYIENQLTMKTLNISSNKMQATGKKLTRSMAERSDFINFATVI